MKTKQKRVQLFLTMLVFFAFIGNVVMAKEKEDRQLPVALEMLTPGQAKAIQFIYEDYEASIEGMGIECKEQKDALFDEMAIKVEEILSDAANTNHSEKKGLEGMDQTSSSVCFLAKELIDEGISDLYLAIFELEKILAGGACYNNLSMDNRGMLSEALYKADHAKDNAMFALNILLYSNLSWSYINSASDALNTAKTRVHEAWYLVTYVLGTVENQPNICSLCCPMMKFAAQKLSKAYVNFRKAKSAVWDCL